MLPNEELCERCLDKAAWRDHLGCSTSTITDMKFEAAARLSDYDMRLYCPVASHDRWVAVEDLDHPPCDCPFILEHVLNEV